MKSQKISNRELQITKEVTETYDRDSIEQQIKNIEDDRARYITMKDTELLGLQNILDEMDKLGIVKDEITPLEK